MEIARKTDSPVECRPKRKREERDRRELRPHPITPSATLLSPLPSRPFHRDQNLLARACEQAKMEKILL